MANPSVSPSDVQNLMLSVEGANAVHERTPPIVDRTFSAAVSRVSNFGKWLGSLDGRSRRALGGAALALFTGVGMAQANPVSAESSHVGRSTISFDDESTSSDSSEDINLTNVENRMAGQAKGLVDKGASEDAAKQAVADNASAFFAGGEDGKISPEKVSIARGKIFETRPDGVCLIETFDGQVAREFGHLDLRADMTPEEAKRAAIEGLCPSGDVTQGANIPAIASGMARLEAMKNGVDINKEFNKVYGENANKYVKLMEGNPQRAQSYLDTLRKFYEASEFGSPVESSHDYVSNFAKPDGEIIVVNVHKKNIFILVKAYCALG